MLWPHYSALSPPRSRNQWSHPCEVICTQLCEARGTARVSLSVSSLAIEATRVASSQPLDHAPAWLLASEPEVRRRVPTKLVHTRLILPRRQPPLRDGGGGRAMLLRRHQLRLGVARAVGLGGAVRGVHKGLGVCDALQRVVLLGGRAAGVLARAEGPVRAGHAARQLRRDGRRIALDVHVDVGGAAARAIDLDLWQAGERGWGGGGGGVAEPGARPKAGRRGDPSRRRALLTTARRTFVTSSRSVCSQKDCLAQHSCRTCVYTSREGVTTPRKLSRSSARWPMPSRP